MVGKNRDTENTFFFFCGNCTFKLPSFLDLYNSRTYMAVYLGKQPFTADYSKVQKWHSHLRQKFDEHDLFATCLLRAALFPSSFQRTSVRLAKCHWTWFCTAWELWISGHNCPGWFCKQNIPRFLNKYYQSSATPTAFKQCDSDKQELFH